MKSAWSYGVVGGVLLSLSACGGLKAPRKADGSQMKLFVFVDYSATEGVVPADNAEAADFMGSDLAGRLGAYEWATKIITSEDEAELEPGAFLAHVKLTEYMKGDDNTRAAGRLAGSFGGAIGGGGDIATEAASAHAEVEYEVRDEGGAGQCSGSVSKGSEKGWKDAIVFVNKEAARAITRNMQHLDGKF